MFLGQFGMIQGKLISLLLNKYFIGGILGLMIMVLIYNRGYQSASEDCEAEKIKALEAMIEYQNKIHQENLILNESIFKDLSENRQETKVIVKKVIEYVDKNPDTTSCSLDDSGLRIWNGETN